MEKNTLVFFVRITKGLIFHENFQSSEDKLLPDREVDRTLATKPDTSFSVIEISLGNYPISTGLALLCNSPPEIFPILQWDKTGKPE